MLTIVHLSLLVILLTAVWGLVAGRVAASRHIYFAGLLLGSVLAVVAGAGALFEQLTLVEQLPFGLPWLHWHFRLDPLSGFFLIVIGLVTGATCFYGPAYLKEYKNDPGALAHLGLFTALFVLGMELVVLADDAFAFMVAWEVMSLSSYFLVVFQHHHAANRRAGFLYLLMAHIGALAILLGFGVLAGFGGGFTFDLMRQANLSLLWSSIAFALALFGFGMKAGLVPVHAWLPEAHPVAPSHISALMSGVMLKVAVYGFIRFTFDLIGEVHWGWGVATLAIASISALMGVLYALMQHELKRLLAYHSIENIGIIFIGLGLALIFFGTDHPLPGVIGLIAALYHTINHALFKGLLFLGAGAILHTSHLSDMERMGGLIRRMPQTAFLFLIGCIAISALPPFNGFVSEWLTFQSALQGTVLENGVLAAALPISAAMLALTGALAAACFVKVYGVVFLGKARGRRVRRAHEVGPGMRIGMAVLALLCLLFGIFPTFVVGVLDAIPRMLVGVGLAGQAQGSWLWLTPVTRDTASYSALFVVAGLGFTWLVGYWLLHRRDGADQVRKGEPWDCGFGGLNTRMQYTATAFAMPIRRIFESVWRVHENIDEQRDSAQPLRVKSIRYELRTEDHAWYWFYLPVARIVQNAARRVARIQTGHIRTYLAYSFVTLLVLLWVVS